MTRKSIVRAALVIAAGLMMFTGAPVHAAPSDSAEQAGDAGKPLALTKASKPRAKVASRTRKPKIAAHRSVKSTKAAAKKPEKAASDDGAMPAAVANAKAEMPQAEARGAAEITPSAPTVTPLAVKPSEPAPSAVAPSTFAPSAVAPSDQMSELDRAVSASPDESEPRAIKTELVKSDRPEAALPIVVADNAVSYPQSTAPGRTSSASVTAASGDAWAQSSLIGKIFIAFGGMLTLASAARMLIA